MFYIHGFLVGFPLKKRVENKGSKCLETTEADEGLLSLHLIVAWKREGLTGDCEGSKKEIHNF